MIDTILFLGTLFLWMYWPSFNAAMAPGDDQHRAVLNTYYALCSCTIVAFACSAMVDEDDKFHTVSTTIIQYAHNNNATRIITKLFSSQVLLFKLSTFSSHMNLTICQPLNLGR